MREQRKLDRAARQDSPAGPVIPLWVGLSDPAALRPEVAGAKAAALAAAADAGLPVLPGSVLTTAGTALMEEDGFHRAVERLLDEIFEEIGGGAPLVVRSSSTAEDGVTSSMAGMFTSILDVTSRKRFHEAVEEVVASAGIVSDTGERVAAPMAVLIQPQLDAIKGGVLFGVDPITGARDRYTIAATDGGPDSLVSGMTDGTQLTIDRSGRLITKDRSARAMLTAGERRALARLARLAEETFGGPQDIEWGFSPEGHLYLFQSRPVTAIASPTVSPVLGPGPVAETFPDPLARLEEDLWIEPLRAAVGHALEIAGAATRRSIARSPVVVTVGGRVAADLELFGIRSGPRSLWSRIDPRAPARRMLAAWRVGRLKASLKTLTDAVAAQVDADLDAVPALRSLSSDELLNVLAAAREYLRSIHGYEILSGLLDTPSADDLTGAELGLRKLTLERREGNDDTSIMAAHPEVLALTPPAIAQGPTFPATSTLATSEPPQARDLNPRESMRLRVRWIQELSARATWVLGQRMNEQGLLSSTDQIRHLTLVELAELVALRRKPADLDERSVPSSAPLPAFFRLNEDGTPIPVAAGTSEARGAGGGRGIGRVSHGPEVEQGDVLVVTNLDPALAAVLPRLGGLIAETGSVLSHLAILAREFGVPTVVGAQGARERFAEGIVVIVDGSTGEISEVAET